MRRIAVSVTRRDTRAVRRLLGGVLIGAVLVATPRAAGANEPDPTLRRGDGGPQVVLWQHMLNLSLGTARAASRVREDGVFGPATERATRRVERNAGHDGPADGVVTTADRILLLGGFLSSGWQGDPPLAYGDWDPRVGHLQVALNVWSARARPASEPLWIDMLFGPHTEAAVRAFQASAGLAVDGIVGPRTWSALGDEGVLRFPPKDFP